MKKQGYVYEYINKENGKWYIGSHDGSRKNYTASGIAINKAFEKYGMDKFIRHIFYCDDFRKEEETCLQLRDAMNDPMSYNLKNNAIGWTGTHTEDTKKRIGDANRSHQHNKLHFTLLGVEYVTNLEASLSLSVSVRTIQRWKNEIPSHIKNKIS